MLHQRKAPGLLTQGNDELSFTELKLLQTPQVVTLGDGRSLKGTAEGIVILETLLPDGCTKKCKWNNVLLVPKLSYSLLSVSKASSKGKTTRFDCEILNEKKEVITFATRVGNLYHLEHCAQEVVNVAGKDSTEKLWHRRYGHLGERIAKEKLVEQFNYDAANKIGFCETCVGGKHHRSSSTSQTTEALELVHSDVCGKIRGKIQESP